MKNIPQVNSNTNVKSFILDKWVKDFQKTITDNVHKEATSLYSDKSDFPEFFIHPNWDAQGNFNVIVATDDKYTFETTKQFDSINNITLQMWLTEKSTGNKIKMGFKIREMKVFDTMHGNAIYYSKLYPLHNLSFNSEYYVDFVGKGNYSNYQGGQTSESNGILWKEWRNPIYKYLYEEEFTNQFNSDGSATLAHGCSRGYAYNSSFDVFDWVEKDEMLSNASLDKNVVLLPNNITKKITSNYEDANIFVLVIVLIILEVAPTSLLLWILLKK